MEAAEAAEATWAWLEPLQSQLAASAPWEWPQHLDGLVKKLIQEGQEKITPLFKADWVAMQARAVPFVRREHGGERFAPAFVLTSNQGEELPVPDLSAIEDLIVELWAIRADQWTTPTLKARYVDLLYVYGPKRNRGVWFRQAIGAYCDAADAWEAKGLYSLAADALVRASEITIRGNTKGKQVAGPAIDRLEVALVRWSTLDLGAALDIVKFYRAQPTLRSELPAGLDQLKEIISGKISEGRPETVLPLVATMIDGCKVLGDFSTMQAYQEVQARLLETLGEQSQSRSHLVAAHWYRAAEGAYRSLGGHGTEIMRLRRQAQDQSRLGIVHEFRAVSIHSSWPPLSFTTEELLGKTPDDAVYMIAGQALRISDPSALQVQAEQLAISFPLMGSLGQQQFSLQGNLTARATSEDEIARMYIHRIVVWAALQDARETSQVVRDLIDAGHVKIDTVMAVMRGAPLLKGQDYRFFEAGLRQYWAQDYVAATHILVPRLEATLRGLLSLLRLATNRLDPDRNVEFERALWDVLTTPELEAFLTPSVTHLYRVLLADPTGYNLRNRIAHGLISYEESDASVATLVVLLLLHLAVYEVEREDQTS